MRHRLVLLLAPAVAVGLAACGSTVQIPDQQALAGQQGSLSQPGAIPGTGTGPGGSLSTAPGAGSVLPPGGSLPGVGSSPGSVPGSPVPTAPGEVPGSEGPGSSGPIQVGITYTGNGEAANAALGASAITRGNEKAAGKAVIDEINATGGINGRKLEPVFFEYEAASSQTMSQQDQEACAHFTEDNHITVLIGGGGDVSDQCMFEHGVLVISSGVIIQPDRAHFDRYPNFFQLGTLSQDRMMADQVATLQRLGYFSGWSHLTGQPATGTPAKIGILSLGIPEWERPLRSVLLPRLAAAGHPVDSGNIYPVRSPSSNSELAGTVADIKNATLKFQSAGVTHVIILDSSATITLLFAQNARQQQYYPRYGANSATGMQALYDAGVVDNNQLNGAVGLGWLPNIDLTAATGEKYSTPATKRCLEIIKRRTGQTFTSTNAAGLAVSKCDMADLMRIALTRGGPDLSLPSMVRAIEDLGGNFKSPFIPLAFFSPGRHDAVQLGFDMVWDTGCSCTKYVGTHTIP